ncbi:glycosyltransferase family 2 protein [Methylobacterium sp. C25]|uniref:glycosyltransferase family 2 protein n=1 Tax=Methylobacterium sp. C25 TaxID=2721622 RepID=UPI001F20553B|nr:glycosyltransferase family 2 protein [Methylobacterium sp. C25]MCE4225134.1 glycosyltransferase family 2 protein [Methylobacterium sp. C25]
MPAPVRRLRIAVGLATAGRPDVACQMLVRLGRQSRPPDAILVSVPTTADIGLEAAGMPAVTLLVGARGLTRQRNAILERLDGFDLVCFLDDDFVVGDDYLAAMEQAFLRDPGLAGATGVVLADGITGAGYSFDDAERVLAAARSPEVSTSEAYNAYGCNMVFSVGAIRRGGLRFDESLPRYGWLEDVDFSRRIARFGSLGQVEDALGVHLGVKGGRQSGLCFGYSQIANPLYLVRKGSYVWHRAAWLMSRNVAMNLLRSARPEPHVDRRGRLAGNAAAFVDLLRRRLDPERIDSLS